MAADEENSLVMQLTGRLEELEREKYRLERAVEGQGDAIALQLRLALLAYEQQKPPEPQRHSHRQPKSRTGSSSSSVSTSASTSSSVSFPSSPSSSSLISPTLPAPEVPPDVLLALRENETLRVRLANSERVNAYYQRELAELRRRCGISIDELEELDLAPGFGGGGTSLGAAGSAGGSFPRQRSLSRPSRLDAYGGPSTSSIRIPGSAASVSPPGAPGTGGGGGRRSLASSFMFSPDGARSARFAPDSYTSSINTTATTPSSSYPNPRPPAATPATNAAFSPASANANISLGGAGLGFGSNFSSAYAGPVGSSTSAQGAARRRNSLNGLVAAHFANASLQSDSSIGVSDSASNAAGSAGGGIDLDDLVSLGGIGRSDRGSSSSRSASLDSGAHVTVVPPTTTGSADRTATSVPFPVASGGRVGEPAEPQPEPSTSVRSDPVDPLVAAITRGLAKLVAEGAATLVDEDEAGDETLSGDAAEGSDFSSAAIANRLRLSEDEEGDGAETPLSNEASRAGSMRRRAPA
ncbi:hypothetical protein JCM8202_000785 [Rhodotorula sphaerocarpa]